MLKIRSQRLWKYSVYFSCSYKFQFPVYILSLHSQEYRYFSRDINVFTAIKKYLMMVMKKYVKHLFKVLDL